MKKEIILVDNAMMNYYKKKDWCSIYSDDNFSDACKYSVYKELI